MYRRHLESACLTVLLTNYSYCNSILQCLYYSVPFREQVINYPRPTLPQSVISRDGKQRLNIDATPLPPTHPSLTYNKLMNKPNVPIQGVRSPGGISTTPKPEDKEHPDFKKRVALARGPNIAMSYENMTAYDMPESLFTSLKDIFEAVYAHQSRVGVVSPSRFLEVLRRENEMFRTAMHQDAHEFLILLLNEVVENVEAHSRKLSQTTKPLNGAANGSANGAVEQSGFEKALVSAMTKATDNSRWVHELFEGLLTSETKCLTCENVSQRDEAFLDLSVDLEEHTSVTACLRKFSEEEMLCERNKFHCDRCGGLQEAEKRMKIKRLPKILALHLKRFKYTEDLQRLQKLFYRVVYPYHMRLFNTTDDVEDPDRLYELYAVVVHIGGGPYHGHYISIIKTQDRGWLLFDDEMVEPVDKSYVQNFFGDRPGLACAYVLFYQETTPEAMRAEQDAEARTAAAKAAADAPPVPTPNIGLGLKTNGLMNGIHHVRSAVSPGTASPEEPHVNLEKTLSEPLLQAPINSTNEANTGPSLSLAPGTAAAAATADPARTKKDLAKEEKERRARAREALKEQEKADRDTRKLLETKRKEQARLQDLQSKASFEKPSKQTQQQLQQPPQSQKPDPHHQQQVDHLKPLPDPTTTVSSSTNGTASPSGSSSLRRLRSVSKNYKKPRLFGGSGSKDSSTPPSSEPPIPIASSSTHAYPPTNTHPPPQPHPPPQSHQQQPSFAPTSTPSTAAATAAAIAYRSSASTDDDDPAAQAAENAIAFPTALPTITAEASAARRVLEGGGTGTGKGRGGGRFSVGGLGGLRKRGSVLRL